MEKRFELASPSSCLNKALPEEPLFVLRANDPLFAATVRLWAAMAVGCHEPDKVQDALRAAEEGHKWHADRQPKAESTPAPRMHGSLGSTATGGQLMRQYEATHNGPAAAGQGRHY